MATANVDDDMCVSTLFSEVAAPCWAQGLLGSDMVLLQ